MAGNVGPLGADIPSTLRVQSYSIDESGRKTSPKSYTAALAEFVFCELKNVCPRNSA
jgi:hypothetical protein